VSRFTPADQDLLMRLLLLPTAGPLEPEAGSPPQLWQAQRAYAQAAAGLGLKVVHHAAPRPEDVTGDDIPLAVRRAIAGIPGFLDCQPSLVLRLGPPADTTVMFNVHLDTVAGGPAPSFGDGRFAGRGAIDAKGPAVALLAGLRAAIAAEPAIGTDVGVLVQVVSGEEGGAMGSIGTRPLVRQGYTGRLNLFCEPTGLRYLPRVTAAATACVTVSGQDAIDDRPGRGHNATVLLGFLAQHLAAELAAEASGACIAGLSTGPMHNKVYGRGKLLANLPYATTAAGRRAERAFEGALRTGLDRFAGRFASLPDYALTAADAVAITRLDWLKRGLPTMRSRDPELEAMLEDDAGLARWPDDEPAFSCDAIWMDGVPDAYTAVFGPGDLDANHAHAPGEFARLAELEDFASGIARILVGFAAYHKHGRNRSR
jgi:acetylornithine deacetylase/succinyl-diaminopimelate desuccinylase-like protein